MADVNRGIINYGRIGGNAVVDSHDFHIGDTITVSATNSNVAIKSSLENATQSVRQMAPENAQLKADLDRLLKELTEALAKVPAAHAESAEAVASQTKATLVAVQAEKPNRTLLRVACDGLASTAATLAAVAPPVVSIVRDIVGIVAKFGGL